MLDGSMEVLPEGAELVATPALASWLTRLTGV